MVSKVVITGIGVLSGIGQDFASFSAALAEGRNGIAPVQAFDTAPLAAHLGCEVPGDLSEGFAPAHLRKLDRCSRLAMLAARQAMAMAGLGRADLDPMRVGVSLGTTLGGMIGATAYYERLRAGQGQHIGLLHDYPLYSAGARIMQDHGFGGPNIAFSTACSSGNVALGHGADLIRHGRLDMVLAGGADTMAKITLAGFNALKNVSREAIRPFDANRSGVVLGEGAAVFCLESAESAHRRGAQILAEIAGYGMSTDAYHMTAPDATGKGPALAMQRALAHAGVAPEEVGHINAHGTGTRHNDETETRAIRKVFGAATAAIPVTSTKSMHGHALGATGALEAAAIVAGLLEDVIAPTLNYVTADPRCDLDIVANQARAHRFDVALSNNFGFGGNNCALVIRRA